MVGADVEAAQPIDQRPRNLADRGMAPAAVFVRKPIEEGGWRGRERHFEVKRKRIVFDSEYRFG